MDFGLIFNYFIEALRFLGALCFGAALAGGLVFWFTAFLDWYKKHTPFDDSDDDNSGSNGGCYRV